jgi:hypothetical protein
MEGTITVAIAADVDVDVEDRGMDVVVDVQHISTQAPA